MKQKRRKKTITQKKSKNALTSKEPKRRFGKRQKRKLAIILVLAFMLSFGLNIAVKQHQAKVRAEENKARQGELITQNASKKEYDDNGNEIFSHINTEIHIINVGDGKSILVKKGPMEVLIDIGSEVAIDYLKKQITGELDYLITTSTRPESIAGINKLYEVFKIPNWIYHEPFNLRANGQMVSGQIIEMGDNVSVKVMKKLDGASSCVTIKDRDKVISIEGDINTKDVYAYISEPSNIKEMSGAFLRTVHPKYFIASAKTKLETDTIKKINEAGADLYATYKSKNIVFTIQDNDVTVSIKSEDRLKEN